MLISRAPRDGKRKERCSSGGNKERKESQGVYICVYAKSCNGITCALARPKSHLHQFARQVRAMGLKSDPQVYIHAF